MIPTYRHILRFVALLTALCVAQVYVFAGPVVPVTNDSAAAASPQTGGTLTTTGNKPVTVNGNRVGAGTTILPNTSIQTPEGVSATVQLGFAEVIISPGADVVLDFKPGTEVTVTLKRGCVVIKSTGDARGTIIKPDGTTVATGTKRVANACDGEGGMPVVGTVGASGIDKALLAVLLIGAAGAAVAALTLSGRGFNPSPSSP
jgi:hypothetical protein